MVAWTRSPDALQAFEGQGVDAPRRDTGLIEGWNRGFTGAVTRNPGGPGAIMANINFENARKASAALGEDVAPLVDPSGVNDNGVLYSDKQRQIIAGYTEYMQAAYDADTFRPESGDERRIIGDKYKAVRDLAGKSEEQLRRAQLIDPSILTMDQQHRLAIQQGRDNIIAAEEVTGLGGTIGWLASQLAGATESTTNPAWAFNLLGATPAASWQRVLAQGGLSGLQSLTEDLIPLEGLPTRTESMAWLGFENDVLLNTASAMALGAMFQGAFEGIGASIKLGAPALKPLFRAMPDSERMVLDTMAGGDPSIRPRAAQDLDHVARQLDEGVPVTELTPPSAPMGEHASVAPTSRAGIDERVPDTTAAGEADILARAKKLDPEAVKEFDKATKQNTKLNEAFTKAVDEQASVITRQLDTIEQAIASAETRRATIGELQSLEEQHAVILKRHEAALKELTDEFAKRQAAIDTKLTKWGELKDRAMSRARGEWETESAMVARMAGREPSPAPRPENASATPAAPPKAVPGDVVPPEWKFGDPMPVVAPVTSHPLSPDTGEGSLLQRAQRVVDAKFKAALEESGQFVSSLTKQLDELSEVRAGTKADTDIDEIVLPSGVPLKNLTGLQKVDFGLADGQPHATAYNLRRELAELDEDSDVLAAATSCRVV